MKVHGKIFDGEAVHFIEGEIVFNFDPDKLYGNQIMEYIKKRFLYLYGRFVEETNPRMERWNNDYDLINKKQDCWNNEYERYIFDKYVEIGNALNKIERDGIVEICPQLIEENPDHAFYEGQTSPCFGIRMKSDPDKIAYIEFGRILEEDEV